MKKKTEIIALFEIEDKNVCEACDYICDILRDNCDEITTFTLLHSRNIEQKYE